MTKDATRTSRRPESMVLLEEIAAAERLAADPELGPAVARPHLRAAWGLLHVQSESEQDLLSWSGAALQTVEAHVPDEDRLVWERVRRWALADEDGAPVSGDDVFVHTLALRLLAGDEPRERSGYAWLGAGLVALTVALMVGGGILSVLRGPTGPWRGEWFDNQDFKGKPVISRTRKLEFNWGREAPRIIGFPEDHWSVIWRTCLEVDDETEMRLRVSSDDGSRVYVDGELVLDNWGAHAVRTRTGKVTLTPGAHYVRVDFFEATATAELKVLASFGEDRDYTTIPPSMLREPSGSKDPC